MKDAAILDLARAGVKRLCQARRHRAAGQGVEDDPNCWRIISDALEDEDMTGGSRDRLPRGHAWLALAARPFWHATPAYLTERPATVDAGTPHDCFLASFADLPLLEDVPSPAPSGARVQSAQSPRTAGLSHPPCLPSC